MKNNTVFIATKGGRIACSDEGSGPLVVLSPGMGDLRSSYRFQVPALVEAGYRVVSVDLRGHGESDFAFDRYGDEPTSDDLIAVISHFGGPALIVGNSMSAGAGVLVAARRPDLVSGLVLVGPFVRSPKTSGAQKLMMSVMMSRPLVVTSWNSYLPKLYAGQKPSDFAEYRASVKAAMARPGYREAFSQTTKTSHDEAEASLAKISTPVMVLMGESDPDFKDPQKEADWIASQINARVEMIPNAGHYPHSQQPDRVNALLIDFFAKAKSHG